MNTHYADPSGTTKTVSARISPNGGLDVLSRNEVARLRGASGSGLHALLRRCALAVLNSGNVSDDPRAMLEQYPDFDIQVLQQDSGMKIELTNAPGQAFVDGQIIRGINELLVAVVRDIVYVSTQLEQIGFDLDGSAALTQGVFEILRNARILKPQVDPGAASLHATERRADLRAPARLVSVICARFSAVGAENRARITTGSRRRACEYAGRR